MSFNSPCDISSAQQNQLNNNRINYLQSSARTYPPNYGKSNIHPERDRLVCTSMSFTTAEENQYNYKYGVDGVLTGKNPNSFIATTAEVYGRIMTGFSATGQPSAQYGTQNWTYTNSNTQNTAQFDNDTIACQVAIGQQDWFNAVSNSSGSEFVITAKNGNIYQSSGGGNNLVWLKRLLPNNGKIGAEPYLTSSNDGIIVNLIGENYLYESHTSGETWSQLISLPRKSGGVPQVYRGLVSTDDIDSSVNIGKNTTSLRTTDAGTFTTVGGSQDWSNRSSKLPIDDYLGTGGFVDLKSLAAAGPTAIASINILYAPGADISNNSPNYNTNYVWKSDNSGVVANWTGVNPNTNLTWGTGSLGTDISLSVIATNTDGTFVAVAGARSIGGTETNFWTSNDSGTTWIARNGTGGGSYGSSSSTLSYNWYTIAISGDGSLMYASAADSTSLGDTGFIYKIDIATHTCVQTTAPQAVWISIATSNAGKIIIALSNRIRDGVNAVTWSNGGYIYISEDYGTTWIKRNTLSTLYT